MFKPLPPDPARHQDSAIAQGAVSASRRHSALWDLHSSNEIMAVRAKPLIMTVSRLLRVTPNGIRLRVH